jgi:hypothetical protein
MSAEALRFENKNKIDELKLSLQALKERVSPIMEIFKDPAKPELYTKLKSYPKELYQWFMIMCGEKFQERNIKEVTKSLKI